MSVYNSTDDSSVLTSNDKLWLLSCSEIWNTGISYKVGEGDNVENKTGYGYAYLQEGAQYKYYLNVTENNKIKYNAIYVFAKKNLNGSKSTWFLRSPYYKKRYEEDEFCAMNEIIEGQSVTSVHGISFGFSI